MKMKIAAALLASVMSFSLLSGCSLSVKSPEKLMAPPKLTGDYQTLQDSFQDSVNGNVDFVTPLNGKYKSAFIVDDFDSDGKEDAIVFYTSKEGGKTVNMGVFQQENDQWKYVKNIQGAGNSIDCVIIDDMNGDKIKEITVGWNIFTLNRQFTVYGFSGDNAKDYFCELGSSQYNLVTLTDVDSNGSNELFFVYIDTNNPAPSAFACVAAVDSEGQLMITSKTPVDGNISGYSAIYTDSVEGNTVMLVDAYKNEHDMITEVLIWDKSTNSLVAPLFDTETQTTTATWRPNRRGVADIDADGHMEIPVGVEVVGSTYVVNGELQDKQLYYTLWSQFNGQKLKSEKYVIYNVSENYCLTIPSSWVGKITVTRLDSQLYFYRWNELQSEHMGNQLFSLVTHAVGAAGIDGYKRLADYEDKAYEYCITADGKEFGIKDKNIKDGFYVAVNTIGGSIDE
ncbi:MAG: hypothetical protein MJ120_03995 [Clostridia bacterium]|nr:hypothetical protein [Clostridia bacterium]